MSLAHPRVNASLCDKYKDRIVKIVGKVISIDENNNTAILDSMGDLTITLPPEIELVKGHSYEVIGRVSKDNSKLVKSMTATDFGENIDYNVVEALINYSHKYPEIFGS